MIETQFPFTAWDIIAQRIVTVTGWHERLPGYSITPGIYSETRHITTSLPEWYADAQQREAAAREQALDQEAIRYGG